MSATDFHLQPLPSHFLQLFPIFNNIFTIFILGYKFTGGTKKTIGSIHDGYALLNQGTKNRHVRPTKMNPQSSRSHAIFTIYVRNEVSDIITQSCLNLVDLAGSEGVRRTGHQGVALSEGVHINQGLLSIGKVLQAITHGYKVIPYRDSVLSSVLQGKFTKEGVFLEDCYIVVPFLFQIL